MTATGRIPTDPRIRLRRDQISRSRQRRLLVRSAAVAAAVGLAWAALFSPLLRVRSIRVVGAEHSSKAELRKAVGLGSEDNLLLVSTEEVARKAESLPWVRSAVVDRMLPGTVRISIVERRPAALVSLGSSRWLVDAGGRVLGPGSPGGDLPVVAGVRLGSVAPGTTLASDEMAAALRVLRSLARPVRRKVVAIFAPTTERITLSLDNSMQIRIGAAERLQAKSGVLLALLERVRSEHLTVAYVDVRVPTSPAISAVARPEVPASDEQEPTAPAGGGPSPSAASSPSPGGPGTRQ